jgi:hypothetical protein
MAMAKTPQKQTWNLEVSMGISWGFPYAKMNFPWGKPHIFIYFPIVFPDVFPKRPHVFPWFQKPRCSP